MRRRRWRGFVHAAATGAVPLGADGRIAGCNAALIAMCADGGSTAVGPGEGSFRSAACFPERVLLEQFSRSQQLEARLADKDPVSKRTPGRSSKH